MRFFILLRFIFWGKNILGREGPQQLRVQSVLKKSVLGPNPRDSDLQVQGEGSPPVPWVTNTKIHGPSSHLQPCLTPFHPQVPCLRLASHRQGTHCPGTKLLPALPQPFPPPGCLSAPLGHLWQKSAFRHEHYCAPWETAGMVHITRSLSHMWET